MPGTHDMDIPFVSVIIVNYNGERFLERCFTSLAAQTYAAFETIFVDNASGDGSVPWVREHFPEVRIITNKENRGFSGGNNIGFDHARGTLIATLNNDTAVGPRWLEALVGAMRSDPGVGMCASKMLFMKDPGRINSTGICVSRSGACWDRGMFQKDVGQYEAIEEVFGPCAGAALYRKRMLDDVGFFDESFFAYMEDVDLAFRCRLKGWKCLYVPGATVLHYHGGTAGYMSDTSVYYGNRNIVWNFAKNYPISLLLASLPWAVGRNLAVLPYYVLKGHGKAALRSKLDALKGLPEILSRRSSGEGNVARFIGKWASLPGKGTALTER